jgi:hypothetical protein
MELPAVGYPASEEAVLSWFQRTYHRMPTDEEAGAILDAMLRRDSTAPQVGPHEETEGFSTGQSAAPATRR